MKKLIVVILSSIFILSCGKKGPPVYNDKKVESGHLIQKYFS